MLSYIRLRLLPLPEQALTSSRPASTGCDALPRFFICSFLRLQSRFRDTQAIVLMITMSTLGTLKKCMVTRKRKIARKTGLSSLGKPIISNFRLYSNSAGEVASKSRKEERDNRQPVEVEYVFEKKSMLCNCRTCCRRVL